MEPVAPTSGDPRFVNGSTGAFGQAATIRQKNGPAYGGRDVAKQQNDNDRKQQNYGVTDANFERTLGVIADPDTGQPMSYAQTMQAYSAAGAIEALYPATYAKLVANQNAGRGTVLGGALAILGITKSDGESGASLTGIDSSAKRAIRATQLGDLGPLKDYVLDTRDFKGREWNRAHHDGSQWNAIVPLVKSGYSWNEAALLTGDSMISWAGRVLGSNNQDGDATGFAADELAGLKYMALTEQVTGKPVIEDVLAGHAATHLPADQLTNPKIDTYLGLPDGYRPKTAADRAMVAARLRQWVLQPGVQVDQGEFEKFVQAGNTTTEGRALATSGLLNTVQFKPVEHHHATGGAGGGETNAEKDAATTPTGLGTNPIAEPTTADALGVQAPAAAARTAAVAADTTAAFANGPLPVIDTATGKFNSTLQKQLLAQYMDVLERVNDSAADVLDDDEDHDAFVEGAKQGAKYVKDAIASSPTKVTSLKAELAKDLKDGTLTKAERTALRKELGTAGMKDVAAAVQDGKVGAKELARLDRKLDGAVAAKVTKDLDAALDDGTISGDERASLEGRLGSDGLDALQAGLADGSMSQDELTSVIDAEKQDLASGDAGIAGAMGGAKSAKDRANNAKGHTTTRGAGTADANDGVTGGTSGKRDKGGKANGPKGGTAKAGTGGAKGKGKGKGKADKQPQAKGSAKAGTR